MVTKAAEAEAEALPVPAPTPSPPLLSQLDTADALTISDKQTPCIYPFHALEASTMTSQAALAGAWHARDSWDLGYLDDRTVVKLARGMGAPAPVLKLV